MSKIQNSEVWKKIISRDIAEYNAFPMQNLLFSSTCIDKKIVRQNRRWSNTVECSSHHVRFTRNPTYHPKPDHIAKRGAISSFSRHSRLRLRESLANACLADSDTFGITLTLPWQEGRESLDNVLVRYRECFNRFTTSFRRRFPFSACIFRHELQRRKMPHCHLVLFLAFADREKGMTDRDLQREVFSLWLKSLNGYLGGGSLLSFARHGVKVDYLNDKDAMFRYISDHTSKSKQAQLGYKGKQWGFINRRLFANRVLIRYQFKFQPDLFFFQRHISKACRFFVSAPCVFGKKLSHNLDRVSICFVRGSTVRALIRYIQKYRDGVLYEIPRRKNDII